MTDLFTNPHRYGDLDEWRREAVELHARGPIHRVEQPGYQPFWAVIGHDAVLDIERRPEEFTNAPIPILGSDEQLSMRAAGGAEIRTLIHMDEPDHAKYRKLTNDWFKPASIRRLTDRLDELSRQAVDKLEALGGEADFYKDIALAYPLQVILSILGLPEADYPRMIKLTQEMFGAEDPDLQRARPVARADGRGRHGLLPVLHRADRRPPGAPHRRPGHAHRQRHHRRRADARPREDGLLRHHRHRRPRHHRRGDGRRAPRAWPSTPTSSGSSRATPTCCPTPSTR